MAPAPPTTGWADLSPAARLIVGSLGMWVRLCAGSLHCALCHSADSRALFFFFSLSLLTHPRPFPTKPPALSVVVAVLRTLRSLASVLVAAVPARTKRVSHPPPPTKARAKPTASRKAATAPLPAPPPPASPPAASATATGGVSLKSLNRAAAAARGGASAWRGPAPIPPARLAGTGLHLTTLKGHGDAVVGLAFSSDGARLATACLDRAVRLFAVPGPGGRATPPARRDVGSAVVGVAFAGGADSPLVVLTRGGALDAPGLVAYGPATAPAWGLPPSATFLGGHRALGVRGGAGVLAIASEKTALEVFGVGGGGGAGNPVRLAALDTAGIRTHDLAVSGDGAWVAAATFAPDVKVFAVLRDRAGQPTAVRKGPVLGGHAGQVLAVALSADGATAATSCRDGHVAVFRLARWTKHDAEGAGPPARLVFRAPAPLPAGQAYRRLALDPAGRVLAGATDAGGIHFLDAGTGALLAAVEAAHGGGVTCLEWAPTGGGGKAVLASAGEDRMIHLWESPA